MKKRITAFILVVCILIAFDSPLAANAAASDTYMVPSFKKYQEFMDKSYPGHFNEPLYFYLLDACSQWNDLIDKASLIIGEDLTVERCTEILANMITLMNYQLEEGIVEQAKVDTTKTLLDYGVDLAGIAADIIGTDALGKGSEAVMKKIGVATGITEGALDFTVKTIEELELLVQLEGDYSMQYDFLETVYKYAELPEMREAAASLIIANKEIMRYKVETFTSTGENFAKFAAQDVFLDQVAGELLEDPDFWDSEAYGPLMVLHAVYKKFSLANLAFDITMFLGDSLFGTSDTYNRYNEMLAMRDIHNALLSRVKANPALNETDYANMDRNISLMKMALYVDARGEYCAYRMTREGKFSELFTSANKENIKENYETSIDIIEYTLVRLNGLYIVEEWGNYTPIQLTFDTFTDAIKNVQDRINYKKYPATLKTYCRGDFFQVDGYKAMVLMYFISSDSEQTTGFYASLLVENSEGTISCLTDQLIEECSDPDDVYATISIREIDGNMYLNLYSGTTNNSINVSKSQYYLIGDEMILEYDLKSEAPFVSLGDGLIEYDDSKSVYYLNQEQVDWSTFYSTQDKLNIRTYVLGLNPNRSEGRPPQGYTFEELLAQLPEIVS